MQAPLEFQFFAAVFAHVFVTLDQSTLVRGCATVDDPRNQIPGRSMKRLLRLGMTHGLALPIDAILGSNSRSLVRAWNIRAFTVLTGQSMIAAISSSECPR